MENVFVSNVTQYTGPGIVDVLSRSGYQVISHDKSFVDESSRQAFIGRGNVVVLVAQTPGEIVDEIKRVGEVSKFVFNDAHPNTPSLLKILV